MQIPLLQTKLHIPGPSTGFVSRPQLLEKLRKGLDHGLTLVAAPAGFGKTTLILEWIRVANPQVAWVSLDSGDNDPNRFWTYFIAALQRRQPYLGENALEFLRAQSTGALPGQAMLDSLINDLAALNEDWVLVLDDYHEVETPAIHDGMAYLLDHLPSIFHLLLITRSDPPFPLARWRVSGQLAEIRANDLRFTTLEAAAFLNQALGLSLSEQDIAALEERTEGWIAGLQLAALSMQGQQNFHDFIHTFSGSNRYIVDYLIEEVFNQQPAEIQAFLLQTSVLARMSAPLCNAVLENRRLSSQAILEQLERDNLFVIAQSTDNGTVTIIFAESLRNRLRKMPSGDLAVGVAELHQRASDWFEQNGLVEEAIYRLFAKDFVRSLRLITQAAPFLFPQAGFKTLSDWVDQLPTDQVGANHELMTYLAWMWLLTGQSEKLKTFITTTQTIQDEQASPGSRGRLLGLRQCWRF
jgi:LuxR family maltose regulon positive regulatory protein